MGAAGEGPAGYPQGGAGRSGHGPGYPGNPAPGGTFAADNVEGFVRLLEGSGAITVERREELTVVLRAMR
jgi:hypothetical protein